MPQGTNNTMCVGQAKHYQLCQQQVRTASSTDWSSLGDAGLSGSRLELQEHQHSECDWSVRGVQTRVWSTPGVADGVPWKRWEMSSTLWV